jgi:hypothetical protein
MMVLTTVSLLAAYRLKNPDTLVINCNGIRHSATVSFSLSAPNERPFHAVQQFPFHGHIVFSDYRRPFGVSLTLVDESVSERVIPRQIEFSRQECTLFSDSEVSCKSDFGDIPHQLNLKPQQGIAVGKTESNVGEKFLYTLECKSIR